MVYKKKKQKKNAFVIPFFLSLRQLFSPHDDADWLFFFFPQPAAVQ